MTHAANRDFLRAIDESLFEQARAAVAARLALDPGPQPERVSRWELRHRSVGRFLLRAVRRTQLVREIAERTGISRQLIATWSSGKRSPRDEHRSALEATYGIPRDAWDRLQTRDRMHRR